MPATPCMPGSPSAPPCRATTDRAAAAAAGQRLSTAAIDLTVRQLAQHAELRASAHPAPHLPEPGSSVPARTRPGCRPRRARLPARPAAARPAQRRQPPSRHGHPHHQLLTAVTRPRSARKILPRCYSGPCPRGRSAGSSAAPSLDTPLGWPTARGRGDADGIGEGAAGCLPQAVERVFGARCHAPGYGRRDGSTIWTVPD